MTAEITIMNKLAIAMAADSAMTITQPNGEQKIYNTVNKLFALSKYQPIGIMVYDNAEMMGVPWETVIKAYRSKLGRRTFDTVEEYSNDFINFFESGDLLFPPEQQNLYFESRVAIGFDIIKRKIEGTIKTLIKEKDGIGDDEVERVVTELINERFTKLSQTQSLDNFPADYSEDLLRTHQGAIDELMNRVFEKLPLSESCKNQLRTIASNLFNKDDFEYGLSGVVIAGFGDKEYFPVMRWYSFEGIINNRLKHKLIRHRAINFNVNAYIFPFAQTDMVYTFMQGVDPNYDNFMTRAVRFMLKKFSEALLQSVEGLDEPARAKLEEAFKSVRGSMFKTFQETRERYAREQYTDGVLNAVSILPKDELAAMAEALVNLTVFKHKVSMSAETVGGPIDVAVITKGDGLIWIKRKHYFKAEMNQHFMVNYFKKDERLENDSE